MKKRGDNYLDQEIILRKYLSYYKDKRSYEELKKEALEKGYKEEIFNKIYNELKKIKSFTNFSDDEIKKSYNIKEETKNNQKSSYLKQEINPEKNKKDLVGDLSTKKIQGEEYVLIPVKKKEIESVLKEKQNFSFFKPTQITNYAFSLILFLVFGYSLLTTFNFGEIITYSGEVVGKASFFELGYPLVFASVNASEENPFTFNFLYFFIDFFLYILVAYVIDISIRGFILGIKTALDDEKKDAFKTKGNIEDDNIFSKKETKVGRTESVKDNFYFSQDSKEINYPFGENIKKQESNSTIEKKSLEGKTSSIKTNLNKNS